MESRLETNLGRRVAKIRQIADAITVLIGAITTAGVFSVIPASRISAFDTPNVIVGERASQLSVSGAPHMKIGGNVLAPIALTVFCLKKPGRCTPSKNIQTVTLDGNKSAEMVSVHEGVNREIISKPDPWGSEMPWDDESTVGDCDDYALTKRSKLLDLGWPSSALLLAIAIVPNGEFHLVVVVVTNRGDLVLDNLRQNIVLWNKLPHTWVKRSSPEDPQRWQAIRSAPLMMAELAGCH